jgi:tetratricopeptide (TPR) repeat protein/predicted amidohydrolase
MVSSGLGPEEKSTRISRDERYVVTDVPLSTWTLPPTEPRIAVIQVRGKFKPGRAADRRLRVVDDDSYLQMLFDGLSFGEAQQANFVIFPEYAWPRSAAQKLIAYLKARPLDGTAWLLPFEHLSIAEYEEVLTTFEVSDDLRRQERDDLDLLVSAEERDHAFVNVALTAIAADDRLHVIPHRKFRPAALEEHHVTTPWRFTGGKRRLRIIDGRGIRLAVLICFDLIARDDQVSSRPRTALAPKNVDLVLVPECNPSPLHSIYLRAITAFYQVAEEAEVQPRLCIVNMSAGTRLPGYDEETRFGFSRIVGELGKVARLNPDASVAFDGFIASGKARTLPDLFTPGETAKIDDKRFETVVIRPEATFARVDIPALHRAVAQDPTRGRRNTEVEVYLPLPGATPPWNRVRFIPRVASHEPPGIPPGLLGEQLIGTGDTEREFEAKLAAHAPTWVIGEPGVGKTALVASVLRRVAEGVRLVWLDLGQVEHDDNALIEALLTAFGATRGLSETIKDQEEILRREASRVPTIVVLDSLDRWGGKSVPASVIRLIQWNVWLVVTDRQVGGTHAGDPRVEIIPLVDEDARELMLRRGGVPPDSDYATTMLEVMLGVPLACVWAAEIYRDSPVEAERVRRALKDNPKADRTYLFNAIVEQLSPLAKQILGVLCELAAPVTQEDLVVMFENDADGAGATAGEVHEAILALHARSLVMPSYLIDGSAPGVTFRHPSIQLFWRLSAGTDRSNVLERALNWCEQLLEQYGGERNWRGLKPIGERWANFGYLIRGLARDGSPLAMKRFMKLWQLADTYLWTSGRWRERKMLGERALEFAGTHDATSRAYALYESLAQAEWHLHRDRSAAEPLINEAIAIYEGLGDLHGVARAYWNLSRMLRHCGAIKESLAAAQTALANALRAGDLHSSALALHGVGSALLKLDDVEGADDAFRVARVLFEKTGDDEMLAVIERNRGHLFEKRGRYADALRKLESAMDSFDRMGMALEEAEAALYHARALAKLSEKTDAQRQFERAKTIIERLGSRVRRDQIEETWRTLVQAAEWME